MAQTHAVALGHNTANVLAKVSLLLASGAWASSCASTPWTAGGGEARLGRPHLIYLETNQFLWADARQKEELACYNGTLVICAGGVSRLSLSRCGCLPGD